MAGFSNDVVAFTGVDPRGTTPVANQMTVNGQLLIGSTALPNIQVGTITSPLNTVVIGYSSPNITIDLAGGSVAIDSIIPDTTTGAGTNPVVPSGAGIITLTGGQYPSGTFGTRVVDINSSAANTLQVLVQQSSTSAASDTTKNGLAHFKDSEFVVDPNGFVTLVGGGAAIERVNVQTGTTPTVPSVGSITLNGAVVAAGTNPVRSDGTGVNTIAIEVQISQAIVSTDATKIGLSVFKNTHFSVDASGFVSVISGGFEWTDVTGATQTLAAQNGYLTDRGGGVVYTLPATASIGDTIKIVGKLGLATITPNANQQLLFGSTSGTVGITGTAVATNVGDSVELICTTSGASSFWRAANWVGNWTIS